MKNQCTVVVESLRYQPNLMPDLTGVDEGGVEKGAMHIWGPGEFGAGWKLKDAGGLIEARTKKHIPTTVLSSRWTTAT